MPDSSCDPIRVLAALAVDDELSETERRRLAAHLESCEACRAFSARVQGVTDGIRATPPAPSPHVQPLAGSGGARRVGTRRPVTASVMKLSAVAASIAAALVVGRVTTEAPGQPASGPVILIDVAEPSTDTSLAVVARDYANDRAQFGGDPPPGGAPGPLAG